MQKRFATLLSAHNDFLECNSAAGIRADSPEVLKVTEHVVSDLLAVINTTPVTLQEGTHVLQCVRASKLPEECQRQLADAVNRRLAHSLCSAGASAAASSHPGQTQALQTHSHLQNYFVKSEWDILCKGAIDTRMRTVVSRCLAIGLMFPNESTLVRMVALLYLARDQGEVRPDESYALLRDLKCMLKVMRKTCAKPADSIHIFPSTHTEFQEHYPRQYTHAYPREPPIPSLVPEDALVALCERLPARRTHSSLRSVGPLTAPAVAADPCGLQAVVAMLLRQLQPSLPAVQSPDLALRLLPPRQRAALALTGPTRPVSESPPNSYEFSTPPSATRGCPSEHGWEPMEPAMWASPSATWSATTSASSGTTLSATSNATTSATSGATTSATSGVATSTTSGRTVPSLAADRGASGALRELAASPTAHAPPPKGKTVDQMALVIMESLGKGSRATGEESKKQKHNPGKNKKPQIEDDDSENVGEPADSRATKRSRACEKGLLPCPSVKNTDPIHYLNAVIYTSVPAASWRVKKIGERTDKKFCFKNSRAQAWKEVLEHVQSQCA